MEIAAIHPDWAAWDGPRGASEPTSKSVRVREDSRSANAESLMLSAFSFKRKVIATLAHHSGSFPAYSAVLLGTLSPGLAVVSIASIRGCYLAIPPPAATRPRHPL
jgi:hypothetical protein